MIMSRRSARKTLVIIALLLGMFTFFVAGGAVVRYGIASKLLGNMKILQSINNPSQFVDVEYEKGCALNFLENLGLEPYSKSLVYRGLSLPPDFNNLRIITKKVEKRGELYGDVEYAKYRAMLNNDLRFSYIEVKSSNVKSDRTLIFLHGNGCIPDDLLGLESPQNADAVALDMARAGIRVLIPIKYDMTKNNHSGVIVAKAAVYGTTFEALEQMKIKGLVDLYHTEGESLAVYGFSHGAWQSLMAAQLNQFDILFFHEYLTDPKRFKTLSYFYTDYDAGIASLYNYPEAFRMANVSKVLVLLGNDSPYSSNRKFVASVVENTDADKVEFIFYDGGHYISKGLIKKFIINRRW